MNLITLATPTPNAGSAEGGMGGMGFTIAYFAVLILVFYFLLIRPNKKRQKQMQNMIDSMQKGDEIVTIGGIMGKVFDIRQDCVIIETSADNTKLKFEKTSIARVLTQHDDLDDEPQKSSKKQSKKSREEDVL